MTDMTSGATRAFRFGIVAPLLPDMPTWIEQVRRIADHGYSTVLMPDFPQLQPSPAPTLAVAATVADVRVGTWVYAAPLRAPWLTAWEAHSLTLLTEGRFEMGIGVGRPGIEDELRERGLPVPSPGQRLDQVRETVAALRELDGEQWHTPVAMAVIGPRARAMASEIADTVTFAMAPDEPQWFNGCAIFTAPATSSFRCTSLWSGTRSPRSWHPRTRTPARCGRLILSPTSRTTRERPLTSCVGDVRRSASPTSPSARTLPTHSLRSSLSWRGSRTSCQVKRALIDMSGWVVGPASAPARLPQDVRPWGTSQRRVPAWDLSVASYVCVEPRHERRE
jgi:hypothetical protein